MANIPVMQGPSSEMWMRAAGVGVPSVWDAFGEAIKGAANFYVESKRRKEEQDYRAKQDVEKTRQFDIGVGLEQQKMGENVKYREEMQKGREATEKYNQGFARERFEKQQADKLQKVEATSAKELLKKQKELDAKVSERREQLGRSIVFKYNQEVNKNPIEAKKFLDDQIAKYSWLPETKSLESISKETAVKKESGKFTDMQKAQAEYEARQQLIQEGIKPESIQGEKLMRGRINEFLLKGKIPVNDESGAMGRPKNPAVGKTLPTVKRPQTTGVPGNIAGQEQPQDTWGSSAQGTATQSPISNLQTQKEESLRKLPPGWWNQNLPPTNVGSRLDEISNLIATFTPEARKMYEGSIAKYPGKEMEILKQMKLKGFF